MRLLLLNNQECNGGGEAHNEMLAEEATECGSNGWIPDGAPGEVGADGVRVPHMERDFGVGLDESSRSSSLSSGLRPEAILEPPALDGTLEFNPEALKPDLTRTRGENLTFESVERSRGLG